MFTKNTQYRLADSKDVFRIYEDYDLTARLGWPTVIAERKNKIVGFLSTQDRKDMVVAGPIEVKLKNKAFVTLRLVTAYDNVLYALGVKEYWFHVDPKDSPGWLEQVQETGLYTKIEENEGVIWYKRKLVK